MRRKERGAALIIAMVAIIAIAGMAVALMDTSSVRAKGASDRLDRFRAFQAAQAAVDRAMERMADPAIGPAGTSFGIQFLSDDRIGDLTELPGSGSNGATGTTAVIEGVEYFARVGDAGNGTYAIVGAARLGDSERVIEVIVKPPASDDLPGPFPPSGAESHGSMGVFGDASSVEFDIGNHADVSVSGLDQSAQAKDVLGLAGDSNTYQLITDEVSAGNLDPEVFAGTPMNTLDYGGTPTDGSIGEVSDARVDGDTMLDYAAAVKDTVYNDLIPAADRVISGNNVKINSPETWGTTASPEIVVVDASTLQVRDSVSGVGTLVVLGNLDVKHGDFDWEGDVIVLGSTQNAGIHNVGGTMDITGTVVTIADGNKADFHTNGAGVTTSVDGAMLMIGGNATAGGGLAHFHVNSSGATFNMSGMLMMMGDNTYLKLNPNTSIDIDGDIALAVQASASPDVKVWMKGNIDIQHDSDAVDKALGLFEDFFDEYAPDVEPPPGPGSYDIVLWREK